ncbi:trichohyalin-like isoform X2 [Clarias magur]|uniref:Trichohyalin-like isoform X2 n=1 Tax=Clarias magur TaxID=1594786 RepID=A0A8J4WQP9_CLAMG|nr:trichohyalin-like isoform X2 [Clarias magur]
MRERCGAEGAAPDPSVSPRPVPARDVHNFMVKKKGKFKFKARSGQMMEEQERSELQQREHKTRKAQMRKAMEDPVKEQDEMEKWLQADKYNLALQLEKITRNMEMEKQCYEPQSRNTETREVLMRKEMEDLVIEIDGIKSKFQADKDSLVVRYEEMTRNIQKEKERYDHQQIEFKTREDQMREEMQTLVKEIDKMRETFQAEKDRLVLQRKEKGENLEKEGSELQRQGIEARKTQMREDMERLVNNRDEMQTDRLMVQLEKKPRKLGKEKERLELRQQETEAKEVHIRDEMEMLQNEMKQFQADKDRLVLQLQKEKERCEGMERKHRI